MEEARLAEMYDSKIKAAGQELKKAQEILAKQEELEIASQVGSDKLKSCLVALRTSQKHLAHAILFRNRVIRTKSHRRFARA